MGNHISIFHYKTSFLTLWWFRHFTTVAKQRQVHSHHAHSNLCAGSCHPLYLNARPLLHSLSSLLCFFSSHDRDESPDTQCIPFYPNPFLTSPTVVSSQCWPLWVSHGLFAYASMDWQTNAESRRCALIITTSHCLNQSRASSNCPHPNEEMTGWGELLD